jgi:hypothetical protein
MTDGRVLFLFVTFFVIIASLPSFYIDFLTDMSSYSIIAGKLLSGGLLYHDVVDTKPPLIYYIYASVFYLFGPQNIAAVKILTILVNLFSIYMVYRISESLYTRRIAFFSAILFAFSLFSGVGDDFLSTNTETYMNLFLLISIYFFVRKKFSHTNLSLFLSGIFASIGFLFRLQGGIIMPVFALSLIIVHRASITMIIKQCITGIGFLLPISIVLGIYWHNGRIDDLYFWVLKFNFFYIETSPIPGSRLFEIGLVALIVTSQLQSIVFTCISIRKIIKEKKLTNINNLFMLLLLLGSIITYFVGGKFHGHYFIQVLPPLALLGGLTIASMFENEGKGNHGSAFQSIYIRNILLFLIAPVLFFSAIDFHSFRGRDQRYNLTKLIDYFSENFKAGDEVLIWGPGGREAVFYSGLTFSSRFYHNRYQTGRIWGTAGESNSATIQSNEPLVVKESWGMLLKDLKDKPPRLILDDRSIKWNFPIYKYPELNDFVKKHYTRKDYIDEFVIYVRN